MTEHDSLAPRPDGSPQASQADTIQQDIRLLNSLGYGQELLRLDHDLVFAVRAMQIDFLRPARLDDALQVGVSLRECRRASAVFAQDVRRGDEVLLTATVRVAALDAAGFRPRPIPQPLLDGLKALEGR